MTNPWQLYDDLIDLVPADRRVRTATVAHWALVTDDSGGAGVSMVHRSGPHEALDRNFIGRPLRDLAALVRSWDLELASLGMAALNCGLNTAARLEALPQRTWSEQTRSSFDLHAHRLRGRRVGVVGHFGRLQPLVDSGAEVVVLERRPAGSDLPDPAAEYVLSGCDVVFITGSTAANKTLPRLLELSRGAEVILVGPSTPLAPEVLTGQVQELAGALVSEHDGLAEAVAAGASLADLKTRLQPYNATLPTSADRSATEPVAPGPNTPHTHIEGAS